MKVSGQWCEIPQKWCEPAEPEIEDGRLCRFEVGMFLEAYGRYYKDEDNGESKVTPVHRRWSELTEEERYSFAKSVGSLVTSGIYRTAYRLITGEEHP